MTLGKTIAALVSLTIVATSTASAQTTTAFNTGDRTTGITKLCFYNGLSSEDTKTIQSVGLCPLSIWVRPRS
jgi:hypothetical protein